MADILIVDDSASMRQMIKFTLDMAGHKVSEATDGLQGLAMAEKGSYELIISDVNMPNMSGIEMTAGIQALGSHKSTPILLLTTESGMDKNSEGKKAGATDWLVKPFDPEQLTKIVKKLL